MTVFFLYFWTINLVGNTWKIKRLLRKEITFVLVQKNSEKGPPTESVRRQIISTTLPYYPPVSKICPLIVSVWMPILSDWSYMIIFCIYYQVLQVGSPFSTPNFSTCFALLRNWATCLWGESSALFHSHLFFSFGISESCSAQKCFHSSWTIKSIITAVCFANMNGHEWQQARQTFSFDLSSVM